MGYNDNKSGYQRGNGNGNSYGKQNNNNYQKNEKAKDDEVGAIWGPYRSKNGKEYFKLEVNGQKLIAFPNKKAKDIHPDFRIFLATPSTNSGGGNGNSYSQKEETNEKPTYSAPQNDGGYNGSNATEDDFPNF
ncbi:MAG: hypothetical protein ACRCTZ_14990 [Sarcina sp.]